MQKLSIKMFFLKENSIFCIFPKIFGKMLQIYRLRIQFFSNCIDQVENFQLFIIKITGEKIKIGLLKDLFLYLLWIFNLKDVSPLEKTSRASSPIILSKLLSIAFISDSDNLMRHGLVPLCVIDQLINNWLENITQLLNMFLLKALLRSLSAASIW